jgi:hypothetical protein
MTEEIRDKTRSLGLDRLTEEHLAQFARDDAGEMRARLGLFTAPAPGQPIYVGLRAGAARRRVVRRPIQHLDAPRLHHAIELVPLTQATYQVR